MRKSYLSLALLIGLGVVAHSPAAAVTNRTASKPYELGAFSGLAVWPAQVEDVTGIGEHQCTNNQKNGACFGIAALETSATMTIVDETERPVGAWYQMLQCNLSVTSCSQLSAETFCESKANATIPGGATHLQISLGFSYGQFRCPEVVPGDTGLLHPGTWGHIDVTFYKPFP